MTKIFLVFLWVAAAFGFENVVTIALALNFVTYFNGILHFELADAANELTNYMGTSYFLTILVVVLTDTYMGRFKAVLFSGFIEFLVRWDHQLSFKNGVFKNRVCL